MYDLNDGVDNHYGWIEDVNGHRTFNRCFNSEYYGNKRCGKMNKKEIETVFNIELSDKLTEIMNHKWEQRKQDKIKSLLDNPYMTVNTEVDLFISHGYLDIIFHFDGDDENLSESYYFDEDIDEDNYEDNYDLEIMLRCIYDQEQKEKIRCLNAFIIRHLERTKTHESLHINTKLNHNCIENILLFI